MIGAIDEVKKPKKNDETAINNEKSALKEPVVTE